MTKRITPEDQAFIDKLMDTPVPKLKAFDWLKMDQWRVRPEVRVGELGVELNRDADQPARGRYAPFPPKLVLAVDNGEVLFEDGRRVPQARALGYDGLTTS